MAIEEFIDLYPECFTSHNDSKIISIAEEIDNNKNPIVLKSLGEIRLINNYSFNIPELNIKGKITYVNIGDADINKEIIDMEYKFIIFNTLFFW